LEHVSGVAFVSLMMARINVDMFLEALLLNKRSKTSRIGSANMIMVCAIVHALTVPQSDVSSNLPLGCVFAFAYNIVSSSTYAYIPWLLKQGYKDAMSIAFVTSMQQALGGFAIACISNRGFSGLFDGFVTYRPWILLSASLLLDSSCLLGLQYLSPLAITMLGGAMQVPVMLGFEILFFKAPRDAAYLTSAFAVLASVASYTITDREVQQQSANEMKLLIQSHGASISEEISEQLPELRSELQLHPTTVASRIKGTSVDVQVPQSQPIFMFDEHQSCVPSHFPNGQIITCGTENGDL